MMMMMMMIMWTVGVRDGGSERGDDEVSLECDSLFVVVQPLTVVRLLRATELHAADASVLCHDLDRIHKRQELAFLFLRQFHLLPFTRPRPFVNKYARLFVTLVRKCMLAAWRAAPWLVALSMRRALY